MCRSIHTLRTEEGNAGREAVEAAARQYVRKVTGYRQPSRANPGPVQDPCALELAPQKGYSLRYGSARLRC